MKTLNQILKGSVFVLAGFGFTKILGYAYSIIVARLGAVEYGIFNLINILVEIAVMVSLIGLNEGVVRYISFYQGKKNDAMSNKILSTALIVPFIISLVLTLAVFLSSGYIAKLFHANGLSAILRYAILILPIMTIYRIALPSLRGFKAMKYWMYSNDVWKSLVQFAVGTALILLGYGLFGAVAGFAASILVACGFSLYYLRKVFKFKIAPAFNKGLIVYSYPILFTNLLILIKDWLSTLMIGYFIGVAGVGIYSIAVPTVRLLTLVPAALTFLFFPVITEKYAKKKSIKVEYYTVTKWVFMANLPFALLMILLSKQLISQLFGDIYITAAIPLVVLAVAYTFENTLLTSKFVLYMQKRTKLVFMLLLFTSLSNVALNIFLIPKYGINGAAIATALSMIALSILYFFFSTKYSNIRLLDMYYLKILLAGFISMLICYITGFFIEFRSILYIVIIAMEFAAVYTALLFIFKILKNEEKYLFKNIITRGVSK